MCDCPADLLRCVCAPPLCPCKAWSLRSVSVVSSSEFPFAMSQVRVLSMDPPGTRAPPKAPFNCTGLRYFHSPGPCAMVELGLGQTRFPLCGLIPRGFFVSQGLCKGSEGTWRLSHCPLVKQPRWGARRTPPSPSVVLFENCSRGAKHL